MFLRDTTRRKNGKEHRDYSLVETRRVASGRVVQRHALYLGEINDSHEEAWRKTIEIFQEGQTRQREGRYLLRSNITVGRTAEELWQFYIQLTEVEAAFKSLKDDLSLRPIYHQLEHRIEAHIFISFLACGLHVTLRRRLRGLAPGLTPRSVLEKFATMPMLDVHLAYDRPAHRDPEPIHPPGNRRSTIIAATQTGATSPAAA